MGNDDPHPLSIHGYFTSLSFQSPALGSLTRIVKGSESLLSKTILTADQHDRQKHIELYQNRKKLVHQACFRIIYIQPFQNKKDCLSGEPFVVAFEDYDLTVRQYIDQCQRIGTNIEEDFIWNFMKNVISGIIYFNQQDIFTTFLGVDTVLIKKGEPRIIDHILSNYKHPYFNVFNNPSYNQTIFLPPEYIKAISLKRILPEISIKSQLYSLGVLVLMLMIRSCNLSSFYSQSDFILLNHCVRQGVAKLDHYSELLRKVVRRLLEQQIENRLDYDQFQFLLNRRLNSQPAKSRKEKSFTFAFQPAQTRSRDRISIDHYPVRLSTSHSSSSPIQNLNLASSRNSSRIIKESNPNPIKMAVNPLRLDLATMSELQYIGECQKGQRQGQGAIKYVCGEYFNGMFKEGLPDGLGFFQGSRMLHGMWRKGIFQN